MLLIFLQVLVLHTHWQGYWEEPGYIGISEQTFLTVYTGNTNTHIRFNKEPIKHTCESLVQDLYHNTTGFIGTNVHVCK